MKGQIAIVILSLVTILLSTVLWIIHSPFWDTPLLFTIAVGGIPLFFQILLKLLKGNLGADSLAAIALVTAVILDQYLAATLLILMLSSGQALEAYAMRKASSALLALAERMPSVAHRKKNEDIEDIRLDEINIGDTIVVYPHETCPIDGTILLGHGSMDESYLTGEPYQVSKAPGTFVLSGSINGETVLTIRAQKLASDSRYAAIVQVLQEAEQKRPQIRRLGDQVGAIFAPIALLLALSSWYFSGESIRFLAVLVIATPCPLLIAIPITLISAISIAARHAIIIKDPTVLERLPTCRTAIFDKTGTLTYGKPIMTEILTAKNIDDDFILQLAASLERYSKHPLSSAILTKAKENQLSLLDASYVSEKPGHGLTGVISGHELKITHRNKIQKVHPEIAEELPPIKSGLECILLLDGKYAATFRFRDIPREKTKEFISHLPHSHHFEKIMLVSGDRESEVRYLGKLLKITELYASQTPEQKIEIVRNERLKSPTLFMGDGINDAPALTAATVGIAFGEYSNVSADAAGAVIMENTLNKVDELIHLSLSTRKIALQSAIGGMALSLIGMGFAAAGFITPVIGALLQELIDIIAILNSLRLSWKTIIETDIEHKNNHPK